VRRETSYIGREDPGSKLAKGAELGVAVLDERQLRELMKAG